jgi:cephalosporin hydroxylase
VADYAAIAQEAVDRWHANQDPAEAAGLLALLERVDLPRIVVEIGCDEGGMLWAWQQAGAQRVIGVDLTAAGWGSGIACDPHGADLIRADSHLDSTRDQLLARLGNDRPAILFIDADHTQAGVRRDFELYSPLVPVGGLVCLHDINPHVSFPSLQVDRFWWEIRRDHPDDTWEIVNRDRPWGHGMGIGVLRRTRP